MNKKKGKQNTIMLIIIVGMFIVVGYIMVKRSVDKKTQTADIMKNEIEKLLEKDLESSYPATPREVVKLYSRYLKCIYNNSLTDEEISRMAEKIRVMYDDELLENNPFDVYVYDLKIDIADYVTNDRTVTSYSVDTANNVVTWSEGEKEYARLIAAYTTREDGKYNKTFEEYLLRRDAENKWKIVGFRLTETDELK